MRSRAIGAAVAAVAAVAALLALLATPAGIAGAAGTHHAAVVVEANGVTTTRVVTFGADSISGLDALRAAGFPPVVRGFGGLGAAVCAIAVPPAGTTVGCPSDNSCLTCGGSKYWAYFEAPAGTSRFTTSRVGAGSTRVHDGDVEGWRWGTGDPPPYTSVASLVGPPPAPPANPHLVGSAPGSAPPGTSSPGGSPGGSVATGSGASGSTATTGRPGAGAPPTTVAPTPGGPTATAGRGSTGTTTGGATAVDGRAASHRQAAPARTGGGGGSPVGFVVFGVLALALAAAVVLTRRARRT